MWTLAQVFRLCAASQYARPSAPGSVSRITCEALSGEALSGEAFSGEGLSGEAWSGWVWAVAGRSDRATAREIRIRWDEDFMIRLLSRGNFRRELSGSAASASAPLPTLLLQMTECMEVV